MHFTNRWILIASLSVLPMGAMAQISVGAGGGWGLGGDASRGAHGMAFAELGLPVLPSLRGDLLLMSDADDRGPAAATLSMIVEAPIPVLTPYVIGGWGVHGIGRDASEQGWNVGLGVRSGSLRGLFVEARRYEALGRTALTVGIRL